MSSISSVISKIGFVWPVMVFFSFVMLAVLVFAVLLRVFPSETHLEDQDFLKRIVKVVETFTSLAILAGMIGTAKGLIEVMPELSKVLSNDGNATIAVGKVIGSLTNVFASTFCGLVIAAFGEINQLLLNFRLESLDDRSNPVPFKRLLRFRRSKNKNNEVVKKEFGLKNNETHSTHSSETKEPLLTNDLQYNLEPRKLVKRRLL